MAKLTLSSLGNESIPQASSTVNANNVLTEAAIENTLSRDGTTPNSMSVDLDMGSNKIINLAAPVNNNDAARLVDIVPGADGSDGALWFQGSGAPASSTGSDGDMYLDTASGDVYGPKDSGSWGSSVGNIKGPSGTGTGDMLKSDNLSGLASASTSRTNLGVAIGSDVQAYDAGLTSIAGLTTVADQFVYTTASDTYAVSSITAAGRSILDDATVSDIRTTLGLGDSATKNVGTSSGTVASGDDARFTSVPVDNKTGAYTFVLADAGRTIRQNSSSAFAWTVPQNSLTAFPIGSVITLRNKVAGGTVTLTRSTGVSLYIGGQTTSKDVSFAQGGIATLFKEDTDTWVISGSGLS